MATDRRADRDPGEESCVPLGGARRDRRRLRAGVLAGIGLAALTAWLAWRSPGSAAAPAPALVAPSAADLWLRVESAAKANDGDLAAAVWSFCAAVQEGVLAGEDAARVERAVDALAARARGRSDLLAVLCYSRAWFLESRGRVADASALLRDFAAEHPHEPAAAAERGELLTGLLRRQGRRSEAMLELDALRQRCAAEDHAALAQVHGLTAEILLEDGLFERAAEHLAHQLRAAQAIADPAARAEMLDIATLRQSEFHLATGRSGAAVHELQGLLDRHGNALADDVRAALLLHLGYAQFLDARRDATQRPTVEATMARALAMRGLDPGSAVLAHCKLAELDLGAGDVDAARARFAAIEALAADAELPLHVQALWQSLRAWSVRAAGGPADELRALRGGLAALFEQWRATVAREPLRQGGHGILHFDVWRGALGELVELELALPGEPTDAVERALAHLLDLGALSTLSRGRAAGRRSLADIRAALLGDGGLALVYLPARQRSHLFTVTARGTRHHALLAWYDLRPLLLDLASSLRAVDGSTASPGLLPARAAAVRDALLPPAAFAEVRSAGALTIVGASMLEEACFECLPWDDDRLLGEAVPTAYLPDLSLGVLLAEALPGCAEPRLLLVAQLRPDPATARRIGVEGIDVPPLPDLAAVAAAYSPGGCTELRDRVTRQDLLTAAMSSYDVVQVFAHGVFHAERELGGGIALLDGVLWPDDLHRAGLAARGLVVVSACNSDRGWARPGDGSLLTNLGGAFLWRGASAVVASDSPLTMRREAQLLRLFHTALAAGGHSIAAALQLARAELAIAEPGERYLHAQRRAHGAGHRAVARR